MIDKLWLGVGCSENSVLKIETRSHQSGAQAFSNDCDDQKYSSSGDVNCTALARYVEFLGTRGQKHVHQLQTSKKQERPRKCGCFNS